MRRCIGYIVFTGTRCNNRGRLWWCGGLRLQWEIDASWSNGSPKQRPHVFRTRGIAGPTLRRMKDEGYSKSKLLPAYEGQPHVS